MRRTRPGRIALLVLSGLLAACAGSGGDDGGGGRPRPACTPPAQPSVSLAGNIQPIFNTSCALGGCHDGASRAQGLDLSAGNARSETVNVRSTELRQFSLVEPGKPDESYLLKKIEGTPPIAGTIMPQGCPGNPLNGAVCLGPDQMAAVRTWIAECALAN